MDHRRLERLAWPFALAVAVLPLWVTRDLPIVDLPQHSYAIAVLQHRDDAGTLVARTFEERPGFRPYIGHYAVVGVLARVMPIDLGNRIFLTACVLAFPLSMRFLLRSLGRPEWAALLTIPFAYGDAFGWGFTNYGASVPLMFASVGAWVRALEDASRRLWWLGCLVAFLLALSVFHPVPALVLAVALIVLGLVSKIGAIVATIPGPVVGGVYLALFGLIASVGLSNLRRIDLDSQRNLMIIGIVLFMGFVVPQYFGSYADEDWNLWNIGWLSDIIQSIGSSGIAVGAVFGLLLDNLIPGTDAERGIGGDAVVIPPSDLPGAQELRDE